MPQQKPSARSSGLFIFATACGLLFFQNCQRPVQNLEAPTRTPAASSAHPTLENEQGFASALEAAAQPFASGKVQIIRPTDEEIPSGLGKLSSFSVAATEPLLIVLNNECADTHPGPLSASVDRSTRLNLAAQVYPWSLPQDLDMTQLAAWAETDPCVIGISHDGELTVSAAPNDPYLSSQANFINIGGSDTFDFFNDPQRGARADVLVAVIDSGLARNHPDLKNMLWSDGSGKNGVNYVTTDGTVEDDFGHGTAVSGILAAQANNGVGITGVMGHNLKIMSLKVIDATGQSTVGQMTMAIQEASSRGVDVINISMEGPYPNSALQSALQAAVTNGAFIAVASGNGNVLISNTENTIIPALYSSAISGMMSVGSIDAYSGTRSSFSNYSSTYVEIAAPGSNGVYFPERSGSYKSGSGTSYAAPLVSGAAALVISFFKKNNISYTPANIETALTASAFKRQNLSSDFKNGNTLDLRSLAQYLRRQYLTTVDGGFDEN
ncbi:MAG: S8 family serine peptidase [Bdellovibrionaceae bacterium]|nr:S8 family serine peptidase [Pseudobdellovibrionaceae bacterium]